MTLPIELKVGDQVLWRMKGTIAWTAEFVIARDGDYVKFGEYVGQAHVRHWFHISDIEIEKHHLGESPESRSAPK